MLEDPNRRRSWKFDDLAVALRATGATEVSRRGSHRTYKHGDCPQLLTLVDRGNDPLPIGYVRDTVRLMRAALGGRAT